MYQNLTLYYFGTYLRPLSMQPMNLQVAFWAMQTPPPMLQSVSKGKNILCLLGPLVFFQIVKMKYIIQQR
jgi:hypothetical protein